MFIDKPAVQCSQENNDNNLLDSTKFNTYTLYKETHSYLFCDCLNTYDKIHNCIKSLHG